MIDSDIERQYHDCEELLKYWQTFHDFYDMAIKGEGLNAENEEKFLQIKSRIAMLTDSFIDALKEEEQETLAVGQGIQKIVEASITMKILSRMDVATVKKAQLEWNESFILLTDTIGRLQNKREELLKVSELSVNTQKFITLIIQKVTSFFRSGGFKLAVGAAVVGVVLTVLFYFGLIHKLGDVPPARPVYNLIVDSVYRKFNPDFAWKKIDHLAAFPWHAGRGYNDPESASESQDDIIAKLTRLTGDATFTNTLNSNTREFRAMNAEPRVNDLGDKKASYYTFLLSDSKTAKDLATMWKNLVKSHPGTIEPNYRLVHNSHYGNIIIVLYSSDQDISNDLYVNIFEAEKK
ncbi:hypothetical protein GX645_06535 [Candidatus Sumerlaeota bacterium]|nr:hypothetical protein [Candidatus Sumerlaeota bacterium]